MKKILVSFLVFLGIANGANNNASFIINGDDLELNAAIGIQELENYSQEGKYQVNLRFINAVNDQYKGHKLLEGGFSLENGLINKPELTIKMGMKLLFASKEGQSFRAMPLNIGVKYTFAQVDLPIMFVGGSFSYAPKPLVFKDAKKYSDLRLEAGIELIKNGELMVVYRNINTDYIVPTSTSVYNRSVSLGYRLYF